MRLKMYERVERQPVNAIPAITHHHVRYGARHRILFYGLIISLLITGWLMVRSWSNHSELNQLNEKLARLAAYLQNSRMELEHAKQLNANHELLVQDLRKAVQEQQRIVEEKSSIVTSLRAQLDASKTELALKQQLQNEMGNAEYQVQRLREERDQIDNKLTLTERQLRLCRNNQPAAKTDNDITPKSNGVNPPAVSNVPQDVALGRHLLNQMRDKNAMFDLHTGNRLTLDSPIKTGTNSGDAEGAELVEAAGGSRAGFKNDHRQIEAPVASAEEINDADGENESRRVLIPPPRGVAISS